MNLLGGSSKVLKSVVNLRDELRDLRKDVEAFTDSNNRFLDSYDQFKRDVDQRLRETERTVARFEGLMETEILKAAVEVLARKHASNGSDVQPALNDIPITLPENSKQFLDNGKDIEQKKSS